MDAAVRQHRTRQAGAVVTIASARRRNQCVARSVKVSRMRLASCIPSTLLLTEQLIGPLLPLNRQLPRHAPRDPLSFRKDEAISSPDVSVKRLSIYP